MPQMAPMNWLSLFFMFIAIFLMFNCLNYFIFNYKTSKYSTMTNKFFLNWKW